MVILTLNDTLNVKRTEFNDLVSIRDDCLCNIKANMPLPYIKLVHCYFLFYNDKRVVIKKNGTMINLRNTFQRDNYTVDINRKDTKDYTRINLEHCFLFTDQYGDKNFHHWLLEQFVIIKYYLDILDVYPDCKILLNKNAKLHIIRDIGNLFNIPSDNIVLVDNNELYIIKNMYMSTGRTFNINMIVPHFNKFIINRLKIDYNNDLKSEKQLYIGDDSTIQKHVGNYIGVDNNLDFKSVLNRMNVCQELIFSVDPIADMVYLLKTIREKKLILVVNNKIDENIIYINLLRINNLDVYIVDKEEFLK